ncbi:MAG: PA0069 family radical SAM protein [Gammaproteobacteria bacterium]|nr:PA0069 family radical SAM protein [Gammaproteobacteria bacterium]
MTNSDASPAPQKHKGRGACSNPSNRFEQLSHIAIDDGWETADNAPPPLTTTLSVDSSRTIINYNQSPDIPFDRSINPYRGCEHGCIYCYARPSHAYLGYSPGLDFESQITYKPNAAQLLREEIGKRSYHCQPIALGVNTDAYQPVERQLKITRQILEVLRDHQHPVTIVSKSSLIERDIDLLSDMAHDGLVHVMISVTTLDNQLSRQLEPRAAAPQRRLQTIATLKQAGIPVGALFAPVIPVLNDSEMESIVEACKNHGATMMGYVTLRLPREVKVLFNEWLKQYHPLKLDHIFKRMRDLHNGTEYSADYGKRMTGSGVYADMIAQRFRLIIKRFNLIDQTEAKPLNCSRFKPDPQGGEQLPLF